MITLQPGSDTYLSTQGGGTGPAGALSAIREDQRDSEDEAAMAFQEQVDADFEERRQIGGGLLKQITIKSGYLLKKGERRKVSLESAPEGALTALKHSQSHSALFASTDLEEEILCIAPRPVMLLQG